MKNEKENPMEMHSKCKGKHLYIIGLTQTSVQSYKALSPPRILKEALSELLLCAISVLIDCFMVIFYNMIWAYGLKQRMK